MSLILAPYNSGMRLGQGFNSYTHKLCIDRAVKVDQKDVHTKTNPSQAVSYSARFVERLSDVVEAMNISYSSSIRKGTIEISGNTSSVDETTFKSSDLNAVVSVKVVNQTISIENEAQFQPFGDELLTSSQFNEVYGDSYISGFVEGGDFTGIISIKVLDRTSASVQNKIQDIKATIGATGDTATEVQDFVLDIPGANSSASRATSALQGTQSTISINWMGGGQVKKADELWNVDSMYAAAAAFPAAVASCPQRTWAILTPYKANRSFVETYYKSPLQTLQYELISSYTAELFDSFMDYKLLLKRVQAIINDRSAYRRQLGIVDAIDTSMRTMLSVRSALRDEQTKIVEAIECLSKDPTILKRQAAWGNLHRSSLIKEIVQKALGDEAVWQPKEAPSLQFTQGGFLAAEDSLVELKLTEMMTAGLKPSDSADSITTPALPVEAEDTDLGNVTTDPETIETTKSSENAEESHDGETEASKAASTNDVPATDIEDLDNGFASKPVYSEAQPLTKSKLPDFNFNTLIPPEVWEDLLPIPIDSNPGFTQIGFTSLAGQPNDGFINLGGIGAASGAIQSSNNMSQPGAIVTQSYDNMQLELIAARKESEAARKEAADAIADKSKAIQELENLNLLYTRTVEGAKQNEAARSAESATREATLAALRLENDRSIVNLRAKTGEKDRLELEIQHLRPSVLEGLTDSDIFIFSVTYGGRHILSPESGSSVLRQSIESLMRSNGIFVLVNDDFWGVDPYPGVPKQWTVVYRYLKNGLSAKVRTTTGVQYGNMQFERFV